MVCKILLCMNGRTPKFIEFLENESVEMSNLFDEASDELKRDLTLQDYKKFKEILPENEELIYTWLMKVCL